MFEIVFIWMGESANGSAGEEGGSFNSRLVREDLGGRGAEGGGG